MLQLLTLPKYSLPRAWWILVLCVVMSLVGFPAMSDIPPPVLSVDELTKDAIWIGRVRVLKGEILEHEGQYCGNRIVARVLDVYKGRHFKTLEFQGDNITLNRDYILFLAPATHGSTDHPCSRYGRPELHTLGAYGAMRVAPRRGRTPDSPATEVVEINCAYVARSNNVPCIEEEPASLDSNKRPGYLSVGDLLKYFRSNN